MQFVTPPEPSHPCLWARLTPLPRGKRELCFLSYNPAFQPGSILGPSPGPMPFRRTAFLPQEPCSQPDCSGEGNAVSWK